MERKQIPFSPKFYAKTHHPAQSVIKLKSPAFQEYRASLAFQGVLMLVPCGTRSGAWTRTAAMATGFSYRLQLSLRPPSAIRRICGLDFLFTVYRRLSELRRFPSSLYTFPDLKPGLGSGLPFRWRRRLPRIWEVLHPAFPPAHSNCFKSCVSTNSTIRANWIHLIKRYG